MGINRTKRSIDNAVVAVVNRLITMVAPFILRSVIIEKLGVEYLGLDSLFVSILQILSLSELGFSSAIVYTLYKPIAENDYQQANAILSYLRKVYQAVGTFILLSGVTVLPFIKNFIAEGYPPNLNLHAIYVVFLVNVSISYYLFAYKDAILIATMRNDIGSNIDALRSIATNGVQIFLIIVYKNYYLYVLTLPVMTIINNLVKSEIIKHRFPEYRAVGAISREQRREILSRVIALIGHRIGGVVFNSADTMVISSYLGLAVLGKYSNYYLVFTAVYGFEAVVYQSVQAIIGNSIACRSKDDNYKIFNDLLYINSWVTCVCTVCFICLYQQFIKTWVGKEQLLPFTIPLLIGMFFLVRSARRVCYTFKEAAGMWREDIAKPYISAITNLIFNILLVKEIGLEGVILSSIIALLFVEVPWETRVLFGKYFEKKTSDYYLRLLVLLGASILSTIATYIACNAISDTLIGFVVKVGICILIPTVVFVMTTNHTKEYRSIKSRIAAFIVDRKRYA